MRSSCGERWALALALPLLALGSCRAEDTVVLRFADGVAIAPRVDVAAYAPAVARFGATTLLVPWTEPDTDVAALAAAARAAGLTPIVGLTPARRAQEEWNAPDAPSDALLAALERAAPARAALGGVHLELLGATPPSAAYLDAVVARAREAVGDAPLSVGIDARRVTLARLQDAGFPPPGDLTVEALDRAADREAWARAWAEALAGRAARVVLHAERADDAAVADVDRLTALLAGRAELWVSVDAVAPGARTATAALSRAPRLRTQDEVAALAERFRDHARRVLVRGVEAHDPAAILGPSPTPRAPAASPRDAALEARAQDVDARLWRCCWRDGQIASVYDGATLIELGSNRWQEDACWITGLYTAAAAFRAAVTGAPDHRDRARAAYRGLRALAHATPLPGEVVRNTQRALYDQTRPVAPDATTHKRWRRSPDRELYWVGDISVDQLSGWVLGMTVYHDLVADAAERAEVAADVSALLDQLLGNELHAVAYGDGRTTFGDLRAQPVLALAFFQAGHHLTGDARYRAEVDRLMREESMHWQIANVLALYHAAQRYGSDHFYASATLPLLAYEADPARRAKLEVALDVVHAIKRPHGDAYADMVYGVLHPTHDAARRAAAELAAYRPDFLENARFLAARRGAPAGPYHPLAERPAAELDFDYVPPGERRVRGGLEGRFSGAGFLLTYWMGRFFSVL